jgi:hypothetical protein
MSLESELENARPGDRIGFRGRQVGGKVQGIRGTAEAWIELAGEDETSTLIPDPGYQAAVFRPENCEYFRFGGFKVEGDGNTDRAVQVFTSEHIHAHDLETSHADEDHIHIVGCNHVLIQRHHADGEGGEYMGGGKAGHSVYFTRVDGGGDCEDLVAEDCDSVNIAGAAYQANGDGARLSGVVFRRCRAEDYGKMGGAGINLAQCDNPLLEDITLIPHSLSDNPGIASYDGTFGTTLNRYDIQANQQWSGPMDATPGVPAPPVAPIFGGATPEPPEPPEPEPEPEPEAGTTVIPCVTCGASGRVLAPVQPEGATAPAMIACPSCSGRGTLEVTT